MLLLPDLERLDYDALAEDPSAAPVILPILEEFERRKAHPSNLYQPDSNPRRNQLSFHQSPAPVRLVLGGTNSGKSMAVAQELKWWLCEDHPYLETPKAPQIYVVSIEYLTLEQGIWRHLRELLPEWEIEQQGQNVSDRLLPAWVKMKKGGMVWFISGEAPEEARRKIQAAQLHLMVYDEEVSELLWHEGSSRRLRQGGKAIISACPIRGEPWITELENLALTGSKMVDFWRFDTRRAVEAGHCSKRVFEEMEATLSEDQKEARLYGRSTASSGLVYPEFKGKDDDGQDWHIVDPFKIPQDWTRYCAIDPGINTFAVLWAAVAPNERVYFYDLIYAHRKLAQVVGDMIYAHEGYKFHGETRHWIPTDETQDIQVRWVDPSAFRSAETGGDGVADILARPPETGGADLELVPAFNSVLSGIELVKQGFLPMLDGKPRFQFFRTLTELFSEIRKLRWEKASSNPNASERGARPIKKDDHLMDDLRYLASGGLNYVPPRDSRLKRLDTLRNFEAPLIAASHSLQERTRRYWARQIQEQLQGERGRPHIGGLGTDY